jgi:hypothetical protein
MPSTSYHFKNVISAQNLTQKILESVSNSTNRYKTHKGKLKMLKNDDFPTIMNSN